MIPAWKLPLADFPGKQPLTGRKNRDQEDAGAAGRVLQELEREYEEYD